MVRERFDFRKCCQESLFDRSYLSRDRGKGREQSSTCSAVHPGGGEKHIPGLRGGSSLGMASDGVNVIAFPQIRSTKNTAAVCISVVSYQPS